MRSVPGGGRQAARTRARLAVRNLPCGWPGHVHGRAEVLKTPQHGRALWLLIEQARGDLGEERVAIFNKPPCGVPSNFGNFMAACQVPRPVVLWQTSCTCNGAPA